MQLAPQLMYKRPMPLLVTPSTTHGYIMLTNMVRML